MNWNMAESMLIDGSMMQRGEWSDPHSYVICVSPKNYPPEFEISQPNGSFASYLPSPDDLGALDWEIVRPDPEAP